MSIYAVNGKTPIAAWIPSLDTAGNGTTTLTDLVGSNNGTLTNMDAATDWVADTGAGGVRALDFDGVNDYVQCASVGSIASAGSASSWFNRQAAGTAPFIFDLLGNERYGVFFVGTLIYFRAGLSQSSLTEPSRNDWHMATMVWDLPAVRGYVDGTEVASFTSSASDASVACYIGTSRNGGPTGFAPNREFQGRIDDIRIFDQALTADDVTALYAAGNGRGITFGGTIQTRRRRDLGGFGL